MSKNFGKASSKLTLKVLKHSEDSLSNVLVQTLYKPSSEYLNSNTKKQKEWWMIKSKGFLKGSSCAGSQL